MGKFFTFIYFFLLLLRGSRFQTAIRKYGVGDEEIFQTADLFERRNIRQVCLCLHALARTVRNIIPSFFLILRKNKSYRRNYTPNIKGPKWVPKWRRRTSENLAKRKFVKCATGKLACRPVKTKAPLKPVMEVWATPVTCRFCTIFIGERK